MQFGARPLKDPDFHFVKGRNSTWVIRNHSTPLWTKGEYLFFSKDRDYLLVTGVHEVIVNRFPAAQILPERVAKGKNFVMRLYSKNPSREGVLKRYRGAMGLDFAGFKSHKDSLDGVYHDKYLESLDPETRRKKTSPKRSRTFHDSEGNIIMIQRRDGGKILL